PRCKEIGEVGKYGVAVPALLKKPRRIKEQYAVSRRLYCIEDYLKILEDIERSPYSEKPQYAILTSINTVPKIDDKAHFELKGQFLKELRDNTFNGSDHEDANEHIDRVLKIVDLFYILEITQDQIMLRAFPMSLTRAMSRWLRNEPFGSIIKWEALNKKFLSKYCPRAQTAKNGGDQ
ncbi:hypothetical protein Tco_0775811, partial [Tanacetum coccineum]